MTRLEQIKIELKELIGKKDAEMNAVRAQYTKDDDDMVVYSMWMPAELTAEQRELKAKLEAIREKYSRIQQLTVEKARIEAMIEEGVESWDEYLRSPIDLSMYGGNGEGEQK